MASRDDLDAVVAPGFREMRDDRVLVFIDDLIRGRCRSTTWRAPPRRGRSSCPGTSAEEMYQPEIAARTAPGTFVVTE